MAKCEVPCETSEAPICGCAQAYDRGHQAGAYFKAQGQKYGKVHGMYPSNPYHQSDPRSASYDEGYGDAFAGS